ncbi:copper transport protein [Aspergillus nanangensis]|uniref:Copper transport protein n=1 Tax=Aspergillus nanangensis TaxID=2582783 RepID=A0AAD4CLL4_ASPNN|nr:copper transport protein [Aspergillus nanangensis]
MGKNSATLFAATNIKRAVTLLMVMTAPLAMAFLAYHVYLIWAGMTTNESAKWSDWKEDIADGVVFKSTKAEVYSDSPLPGEHPAAQAFWPVKSEQVLVVADEPPREGCIIRPGTNEINQPVSSEAGLDKRWIPVHSMREIDNIYDLGFWRNLRHVFGWSAKQKVACE